MGLQVLGADRVNRARDGSSIPQQKGLWEVTEAKEKLPVPVRLQMASPGTAIRADPLQNAGQASPLLVSGLLVTLQSPWRLR